MFGCPCVRISLESGSVTLIFPSGTNGGQYGFGIAQPASQPVNGSRTVRPHWLRGVLVGKLLIEPAPRFDQPLATYCAGSVSLPVRGALRARAALDATTPHDHPASPGTDHDQAQARSARSPPHPPPQPPLAPARSGPSPPPAPPGALPGSVARATDPHRAPRAPVLLTIDPLSLGQDLGHDRLIPPVPIPRRTRTNPGAVDRDLPDLHQPSLATQRTLHEQLADRGLVPAARSSPSSSDPAPPSR